VLTNPYQVDSTNTQIKMGYLRRGKWIRDERFGSGKGEAWGNKWKYLRRE